MRKKKIMAFLLCIAAIVLKIILCNNSEFFAQHEEIFTICITTSFAAALLYFALCHTNGWHDAEKKTGMNEYYIASAFVFISGLTMATDIMILEIIGETFWEWTGALAASFWYEESKSKWAFLAMLFFLILSLYEIVPNLPV